MKLNYLQLFKANGEVFDGEWKGGTKHGSGLWKGPKGTLLVWYKNKNLLFLFSYKVILTLENGKQGKQMGLVFTHGSMVNIAQILKKPQILRFLLICFISIDFSL